MFGEQIRLQVSPKMFGVNNCDQTVIVIIVSSSSLFIFLHYLPHCDIKLT